MNEKEQNLHVIKTATKLLKKLDKAYIICIVVHPLSGSNELDSYAFSSPALIDKPALTKQLLEDNIKAISNCELIKEGQTKTIKIRQLA